MVFANSDNWGRLSAREQVVEHIGAYVRFNARRPELARIIMFETIVRSDRYDWLAENYLRPFTERAITRTALAQEEGVFRDDIPPLNLYHMNVAASRSLFLAAPELNEHFGVDIFAEEEIERHIESMVKLFVVPETVESGA
jgi:hypothetical protein